jgi:hypothetical protein
MPRQSFLCLKMKVEAGDEGRRGSVAYGTHALAGLSGTESSECSVQGFAEKGILLRSVGSSRDVARRQEVERGGLALRLNLVVAVAVAGRNRKS